MRLTITGKDFKLTEGIKEAVRTKAKKISRLVSDDATLLVELSVKGNGRDNYIAYFDLHTAKFTVKTTSSSDDMYASIRNGAALTVQKLNKLKGKAKKSEKRDSVRIPDEPFYEFFDEFFADEDDIEVVPYEIEPVRTTCARAVKELEKMKDNLYIFYNTENDNKLSVMFKKEDGDIGIYEID